MKKQLAKLTKVDLREVWQHEAADFTQWLALEENLALLSEEIGIELRLLRTENPSGDFRLDILAEEEGSGQRVIIENQLEKTNHDHLGKIITYAAGADAKFIIWIVEDVREEHRKAVDWLNEHTDGETNFFLIKIEVWKIGDSLSAPKFNLIVSPNEWAKTAKRTADGELSDTHQKLLDFWTNFKDYVKKKNNKIQLRTPLPRRWTDIGIGTAGVQISLAITPTKKRLTCGIYIHKNKELFNLLKQQRAVIEKYLDGDIRWMDAAKASGVFVEKSKVEIFAADRELEHFAWLYEKLVLCLKIFPPLVNQYKAQKNVQNE